MWLQPIRRLAAPGQGSEYVCVCARVCVARDQDVAEQGYGQDYEQGETETKTNKRPGP